MYSKSLITNDWSNERRREYSQRMRENRLSGTVPSLTGSAHSQWKGGTSQLGALCHGNTPSGSIPSWSPPTSSASVAAPPITSTPTIRRSAWRRSFARPDGPCSRTRRESCLGSRRSSWWSGSCSDTLTRGSRVRSSAAPATTKSILI